MMDVARQSSTYEAVQQGSRVATGQGHPQQPKAPDTAFSMPVVGEAQELQDPMSNLDQIGHSLQGEIEEGWEE